MSSAQPDEITLETRGKIAIITLNRADVLNALDLKLYYRLTCLMREVAAMDEVYITVLTGRGRYFSAGANVTSISPPSSSASEPHRENLLRTFVANNLDITHAFYTHPKILITALNGPAIGLSAALIAFSDFIYAAPHAFLLTPFTSLGLVAEGGSSRAFVQRLGISKANEALIMSRKIPSKELVECGFVNKIFDPREPKSTSTSTPNDESDRFLDLVLKEVEERLGEHLNSSSLLDMKALIRRPEMEVMGSQTVAEVLTGLRRFETRAPYEEFRKVASGEKRHKL